MTHLNSSSYIMEPLDMIEYADPNSTESIGAMWLDYTITSPSENIAASNPSKKSKNDLPKFKCQYCNSSFSSSSNRRSHEKTHTGDKQFSCRHCKLRFIQSSNLKSHLRIHSGDKPFKCDECPKQFSRSSHLKGHVKIHTGDLPFKCYICDRKMLSKAQLNKHMEKHEIEGENICQICDVSFPKKSSLKIHLNIHSEKRPYFCSFCAATFRAKEDLNCHSKLHPILPYPYNCSKCGKHFKMEICYENHYENCNGQDYITTERVSMQDLINQNRIVQSEARDYIEFDANAGEDETFCKLELFEADEQSENLDDDDDSSDEQSLLEKLVVRAENNQLFNI